MVSAVSIQALSAVINIIKLVLSIYFNSDRFLKSEIFLKPFIKLLNVSNIFGRNPLLDGCFKIKQQLSIFMLLLYEEKEYLPRIVIKVVNPARTYPIIYANVIPIKLKPNVYKPIFSPISAAIIQRISIPVQQNTYF